MPRDVSVLHSPKSSKKRKQKELSKEKRNEEKREKESKNKKSKERERKEALTVKIPFENVVGASVD